jgi:hypothetical protein
VKSPFTESVAEVKIHARSPASTCCRKIGATSSGVVYITADCAKASIQRTTPFPGSSSTAVRAARPPRAIR